jgi:hypothetical protein
VLRSVSASHQPAGVAPDCVRQLDAATLNATLALLITVTLWQEPGQVQKDLEIEKEASYHISIKVCSVPIDTAHSRSLWPSCRVDAVDPLVFWANLWSRRVPVKQRCLLCQLWFCCYCRTQKLDRQVPPLHMHPQTLCTPLTPNPAKPVPELHGSCLMGSTCCCCRCSQCGPAGEGRLRQRRREDEAVWCADLSLMPSLHSSLQAAAVSGRLDIY